MAVTIKDVAKAAGVSVASVSRALNGHSNVTDETRKHILEVASRLQYVPHSGARSLITRRTQAIGALLPDLHGAFFSELIRGIDLAARARGLHLLVSSSHGDAAEAAAALRAMRGRVDGLLVMSPHADAGFVSDNLPASIPTVLLNTWSHDGSHAALGVDNYGGAYAMTQHLIDSGRRRIAFISGPENNFEAQERRRGYRDAMVQLAPGEKWLEFAGDFTEESGHSGGHKALLQHPQAIFAANDMMAIGCLAAIHEAGLRVPEDVALAGFDDIPMSRYVTPSLSTVRVHIAELGERAMDRLARIIDQPDVAAGGTETLPTELIIRASSGSDAAPAGPPSRSAR